MGRIDDALLSLQKLEDGTERALQLAGLISTLFKIRGVALVVKGQLAYDCYANTASPHPELDLAALAGKLNPRMLQEVMGEQLRGEGSLYRWAVAAVPIRFHGDVNATYRGVCRDFTTDHGVVKLIPAEEIIAERIVAAVCPVPNPVVRQQAQLLLINGLTDAFQMDWAVLQAICHLPEYRVGEALAQLRAEAKQEADAQGLGADHVGQVPPPPAEESAKPVESTEEASATPSEPPSETATEKTEPKSADPVSIETAVEVNK